MMSKAPLFLVFLLIIWGYCGADENDCTYTIVTSQVIKPGRPHQFSVTSRCKFQTNFLLKAWIANSTFNATKKIFRIKTGITKIYSITVPKPLGSEKHFFCVEAYEGLTFYENRSVRVERKQSSLFIQTDKAVYKPGDRVLFRVLALNHTDLKPSKFPVNVTIHDPKGNRIYQSLNLQTKNGIASGKLPLSKSTILGSWTIAAKSKGESKSYSFEVEEYVLPKFKVELRVPERHLINPDNPGKEDDLVAVVNARYTYGQPVKGTVVISIKYRTHYKTRSNFPSITKTLKLENGQANLTVTNAELLDLIPCFYGKLSLEHENFDVDANVTETVTGVVISDRKDFVCRSGRYYLEAYTKGYVFKPGFPFKIMYALKQYNKQPPLLRDLQYDDGSPRHIPVVVSIGFGHPSASTLKQRYLANLTQDGVAYLTIETNANIKSLNIEAAYFDEYNNATLRSYKYVNAFKTRDDEQLQLDLDDDTKVAALQPEKETIFVVRSTKPIATYQYQIFAKESLLVSQIVTGKRSTLHKFFVNAGKDLIVCLAPEVLIVASYVNAQGELVVDSMRIPVINYFVNEVELRFSKNLSHPSDEVRLDINAGKGSTVALLAVDESVRLLRTGNDITKDKISGDFQRYDRYGDRSVDYGNLFIKSVHGRDTKSMIENVGIIIMTNNYVHEIKNDYHERDFEVGATSANLPKKSRTFKSEPEIPEGPGDMLEADSAPGAPTFADHGGDLSQPRTEFPETWIWTDLDVMNNGSSQLSFKVPDTITTWVLSGFAVSEKEGFGIAEPIEMTVFRPMFVSLNLPYSVIRGEEFALVVTIFNYLETDLEVEVSLANSTHFRTRRCESTNLFETFQGGVSKKIQVQTKDSEGLHFWIVPTSVGLVPIEVKASAGKVVDIIKMDLLVKPEGLPQSYSTSFLLGSSLSNESQLSFPVVLPSEDILVPDSADIEVSVIGNIFAKTIENIQDLVKLPAACGEQNIITFAPNVYILNFLLATGEMENERLNYLTDLLVAGFGQQITFQRYDGSYSAFGDKDEQGSVWLSAFVCKSFRHSKAYLKFDSKLVTKTLKWILDHQHLDGSFSEPPGSKIIHSMMQGGSSAGITLTAYVLIALQENRIYSKEIKNLDERIKIATQYLEEHYQSYGHDTYTISIVTYSLHLVRSHHFAKAFRMLEMLANRTSESIHWKTKAPTAEHSDAWKPFYEKPLTYDIEATSYALLIYTAQGNANSLLIAKWLISQQNEAGGYRSTQDTVIALEALSKFARVLFLQNVDYDLRVVVGTENTDKELIRITKENAFLLQTVQVPEQSKMLKVSVTGKGYVVAQVRVKYNVKNVIKHPLLELNVSTTNSKGLLKLGVSTRWLGNDESGMVIVEVEMATGWELKDEDQLSLEVKNEVSKIENQKSKIIFYLNELTSSVLNLELLLENRLSIFGAKPALVKVYQYYDPDTTASAFYSVTGKQTWLTACPECCS